MKHHNLAVNFGVLGIFVAMLGLLRPEYLHGATGPRPMSICGNLVGADGFEWGEVTEGFQMAVALDESSRGVFARIRNGTTKPQPYNATLLIYGGATHIEALDTDGAWQPVAEKIPPRAGPHISIGCISPSDDHTLQPESIMPNPAQLWQAGYQKELRTMDKLGDSPRVISASQTPSAPASERLKTEIQSAQNQALRPMFVMTNKWLNEGISQRASPSPDWASKTTTSRSLIWHDWPAWVFEQPRVKIRITQSLFNRSNLTRPPQPCYEFTIKSPPIEVDSALIRQSVVESLTAGGGALDRSK